MLDKLMENILDKLPDFVLLKIQYLRSNFTWKVIIDISIFFNEMPQDVVQGKRTWKNRCT